MRAIYNRYIRNDRGIYTRIPEDEPSLSSPPPGPPPEEGPGPTAKPGPSFETPSGGDSLSGTLRRLLDQLHLGDLDTGDLLLLAILYFLFREGADEELLAALGLLLIL